MDVKEMRGILEAALDRIANTRLAEFDARPAEDFFEEHGTPTTGSADYCQIAVEVLDRYREQGVEVASVSVTASNGNRTLGAIVSVFGDGTPGVKGEVVEFRDGVATPLK